MRIIVTGSAGFMGSHLVDALLKDGHTVYGFDDMSGGFWRNIHPACHFTELDLAEPETVDTIARVKADVLFHLAADATEGRSQFTPVSATRRNLMGYMNTLSGAIRGGVKKVILTSSMSVYGGQTPPFDETYERMPEDVYAVNKTAMERATEILASVHGFEYSIVRPHNVFGDRQNIADPYRNVLGIWMNRIMRGFSPIIYGDGEQTRAFTYIDNVTPYFLKVMEQDNADGEIFNIGPREYFTINEACKLTLQAFESDLQPVHYPERPLEVKHAHCTADKAEKLLGYRTSLSLQEGLIRMAKWAKLLGPQDFRYLDRLEIGADKAPKTWSKKEM